MSELIGYYEDEMGCRESGVVVILDAAIGRQLVVAYERGGEAFTVDAHEVDCG